MSSKRAAPWFKELVSLAQSVSQSLPSDAEKQEIISAIQSLIKELESMRNQIEALPTSQEREEVVSALGTLSRFISKAKESPALAVAFGVGTKSPPPRSHRVREVLGANRSKDRISEFNALPTDEIQRRLLNFNEFTMEDLRSIARELDVPSQDLNRQDLVDRIVKVGFANRRAYSGLKSSGSFGSSGGT